ncbi:ABC transporter ATP-binding protein [Paenibacillus protaetiae]|uniref:ABC transporter ATP-binding protein n=1 Tax=Paenibacillus protaetiae TaxID=2509456 RepID=A0A4P6EVF7_9BACL|nr:ABC transporter ATP-binding protein [Paenibacillus protaetiae]QAY67280.1 ABC transporter ATP-binding protein [Paenibacillus protaetiae]
MTDTVIAQQPEDLLRVEDLKVHFPTDRGMLKAVNGVNFSVSKGQTLGIVGESGCGKSITGKAIIGIQPKTSAVTGSVKLGDVDLVKLKRNGKEIRAIRGSRIAMIFQEPMAAFSPLYTIGNQIMESILLHRTKNKKEAVKLTIDILRRVGISNPEKRFHQYPHEFSGGMMQRAMIAMALSCNPELLIADEPTTALDVTIQSQVLELMKELQQEFGMAIVFITHDLGIVAEMCDEVAVMYLGKIVERAPVADIYHAPKHPYTQGLLRSIPTIESRKERLESIEGTVPIPLHMPPMCEFYDRCPDRIPGLCNKREVPHTQLSDRHSVSCFLYAEHEEETGSKHE